jgi:hypothetical protein
MYQVLTRGARLAYVGMFLVAAESAAQDCGTKIGAANAAMSFRVNWMGDSTLFNACSVYQAADRPANFPEGISPPLQRVLDRGGAPPCEGRSPGVPGAWTPQVVVDSVVIAGDSAAVFATVRKGEISYFEQYMLVAGENGRWSAREVRIWGAMREYPVPPGVRQIPAMVREQVIVVLIATGPIPPQTHRAHSMH